MIYSTIYSHIYSPLYSPLYSPVYRYTVRYTIYTLYSERDSLAGRQWVTPRAGKPRESGVGHTSP